MWVVSQINFDRLAVRDRAMAALVGVCIIVGGVAQDACMNVGDCAVWTKAKAARIGD